jgi:putative membrane protein
VGRAGTDERPPERRDPIEIAKERYARGEITKEEFDEIKKNLTVH